MMMMMMMNMAVFSPTQTAAGEYAIYTNVNSRHLRGEFPPKTYNPRPPNGSHTVGSKSFFRLGQ